jgi:hypothetical protein
MMPHTFLEPRDDPAFLATIDQIVGACVRRDAPQEVYVVHVNNWFGPKWLRFSGNGRVGFFYGCVTPDTALDGFRREQLTFPPFTPNRIVAEYYFCRTGPVVYEEQAAARLVHPRVRRHGALNLNRRVAAFAPSAQFFWYSSGTAGADRGCLMAYAVRDSIALSPWYVSLRRDLGRWGIERATGIDIGQVRLLAEASTFA